MSSKTSNIICVSGNIGAGKTTYINSLKDSNNYVLLEEPINEWGSYLQKYYTALDKIKISKEFPK